MKPNKPIRVIAVTAGKGGVGKTNVSVNLAIALANLKHKVMLFDTDLGLANVDVLLGLHPKSNIKNVVNGECSLRDVIVDGPSGIKIIPASSGTQMLTDLSVREHAGLISAFSELSNDIDTLIIDTPAGVSDTVTTYVQAANEVIIVVCDEPPSITDAYALIKIMNKTHNVNHFHVLANMVQSPAEGRSLFSKLQRTSDRFLDVQLDYMGEIPFDKSLRQAVKKQTAVIEAFPGSTAAKAFVTQAKKIISWPVNGELSNGLQFFMERLSRS